MRYDFGDRVFERKSNGSFRLVYRDDPILMTYDIPAALPHLSQADAEALTRLLRGVFRDDIGAANKWLRDRSAYFNCAPLELLQRDELGVIRVISYLHQSPTS